MTHVGAVDFFLRINACFVAWLPQSVVPCVNSNQLRFDFFKETKVYKIGLSVIVVVMTALMAGAVNINWVICGLPNPGDDNLGPMAGKIAVLVQGDNKPGIELDGNIVKLTGGGQIDMVLNLTLADFTGSSPSTMKRLDGAHSNHAGQAMATLVVDDWGGTIPPLDHALWPGFTGDPGTVQFLDDWGDGTHATYWMIVFDAENLQDVWTAAALGGTVEYSIFEAINNPRPPDGDSTFVNDVFIVFHLDPVPEPTSMMLLALGSAAVLLRRRKAA